MGLDASVPWRGRGSVGQERVRGDPGSAFLPELITTCGDPHFLCAVVGKCGAQRAAQRVVWGRNEAGGAQPERTASTAGTGVVDTGGGCGCCRPPGSGAPRSAGWE